MDLADLCNNLQRKSICSFPSYYCKPKTLEGNRLVNRMSVQETRTVVLKRVQFPRVPKALTHYSSIQKKKLFNLDVMSVIMISVSLTIHPLYNQR